MHNPPSRKLIALFSLLLFTLCGQAGAQAFVWCIGEDGHAALEYAAGDACGPTSDRERETCHKELFELPAADEHCGPCTDISPSLEVTSGRSWDPQDFQAPLLALPATLEAPYNQALAGLFTVSLYPQPPPGPNQTLLCLRTVVLLN